MPAAGPTLLCGHKFRYCRFFNADVFLLSMSGSVLMGFKRSLLSKKSDQFIEYACLVCGLVSAVKPLDGLFSI